MIQNALGGCSGDDFTGLSSDVEDDLTWIEWYCGVERNEFFVEVDEDYIKDDFNLTGLCNIVQHYDKALEVILDETGDDDDDDDFVDDGDDEGPNHGNSDGSSTPTSVMLAAQTLYGLIHARYITTHRGMAAMGEKYTAMLYGTCPNAFCNNQAVVPIGLSDMLGQCRTNIFCPRCLEVYVPRIKRLAAIDGAFFGTTFAHLFFLTHNAHNASIKPNRPVQYYVPKIYGFCMWRGVKDLLRNEAKKLDSATQ